MMNLLLQQSIAHPDKDVFELPPDELVRRALVRLARQGTQLIVWGALLDQHLNLPRLLKNYTFAVPDEQLEDASETLSAMSLPLTAPLPLLVFTDGDLYRTGYHHRVTKESDPVWMGCLHLVPASLPAFTQDELEPCMVDGVSAHIPRTSAVYASIIRMMKRFKRHCPERRCLNSDLELLVNNHLFGVHKVPADEEDYAELNMDGRVRDAEKTIRKWGEAGEWRAGEEWMEDALVGIVTSDKDIEDLPSSNN